MNIYLIIWLALYLVVAVALFCFLAWDSGKCDSGKSGESDCSGEPRIVAMLSLFWIFTVPVAGIAWLLTSCAEGAKWLYQRFYDAGRDKGVGK
jgi:apolipoprotein N-acyltransferase